jgi:hypothetical protein
MICANPQGQSNKGVSEGPTYGAYFWGLRALGPRSTIDHIVTART